MRLMPSSPRRPAATLVLAAALGVSGLGELACAAPSTMGHAAGAGALDLEDRGDERERMVRTQIEARGIDDEAVLAALRAVPRHRFVPPDQDPDAYADRPLPIGHGQTISQPYIVALMTDLAQAGPGDRVLEIGTGSGYQAAVLAEMGCIVYSIEIIEPLAREAAARLETLGYGTVRVRAGDGYAGWPEEAPFDAVVLTAAPPSIPQPLLDQVAVGGRLVAPVGRSYQQLVVITRTETGYERRSLLPVRFVPMTGEAQRDGRH